MFENAKVLTQALEYYDNSRQRYELALENGFDTSRPAKDMDYWSAYIEGVRAVLGEIETFGKSIGGKI